MIGSTIHSSQLGVQAHCLRREMSVDFPNTLARLAATGLSRIELCSFPGCAGNPWGDFGALAGWAPGRIRDQLNRSGIACIACHFTAQELNEQNIAASIQWAHGVGSPAVVLAGLPLSARSPLADWQTAFDTLNHTGLRLREEGLRFAYHTQNDVWASADGALLFEELVRLTDFDLCALELDLSGTLAHGAAWAEPVLGAAGHVLALHLRDGKRPPTPSPWLPALALGEGDMELGAMIGMACRMAVPHYLLEMEVAPPRDVFEALQTSMEWLKAGGTLARDATAGS